MYVYIYIYSHTHTHKPIFMYRDRHFTAHSVVIIAFRRQISSQIHKNGRWHPLTAQQHPRAWSRRSDRTALVLALSAVRLQHVNNVSSLSSTSNTMCISIYIYISIYFVIDYTHTVSIKACQSTFNTLPAPETQRKQVVACLKCWAKLQVTAGLRNRPGR